jgi:hypothetical protein
MKNFNPRNKNESLRQSNKRQSAFEIGCLTKSSVRQKGERKIETTIQQNHIMVVRHHPQHRKPALLHSWHHWLQAVRK